MEKTLFIVGMGPGVSASVAALFAQHGYAVGAIARQQNNLDTQLQKLKPFQVATASAVADASQPQSLRQGLDALAHQLGPASVLVYNAAGVSYTPMAELTPEQLAHDLAISVVGAHTAAQHVLPHMKKQGAGTVLLTGGGFAFEPMPMLASLGVGKAGIRNLAFSLYADLKDQHIHAATVTIGGVVKPGTAFDPDHIAKAFWQLHSQTPEQFEREIQFLG